MTARGLALAVLLAFTLPGSAAHDIVLRVNGRTISSDVPPRIIAGETFLPLRATAEALGATLDWLPGSKIVTLCIGKRCHSVRLADPKSGARLVRGRALLSLRRTAELLGCQIRWDEESRAVCVTTR